MAKPFNANKKWIVSEKPAELSWHNSEIITGDVVPQIKRLKEQGGPDLWVHGSGYLVQTLLKYHLIDRMHIWIFPVTVGSGKRLFAEGAQAQDFKLIESKVSTTGVIIATYEPAGPLKTGTL